MCALAGAIKIGHDLGVWAGECVRETFEEKKCWARFVGSEKWIARTYADDPERAAKLRRFARLALEACLRGDVGVTFPGE